MSAMINAQTYAILPSERGYKAHYYALALRTIFRKHRLTVDRRFSTCKSGFCFTDAEQEAWFRLFDVSAAEGQNMPFSYLTTSATVLFMQMIEELGVNFKHLRHVKSVQTFNPENYAVQPDTAYTYTLHLDDIIAPSDDRIVIVVHADIRDNRNRQCGENEEYFMVTGLTSEQTDRLDRQGRFGHHDASEFRDLKAREPQLMSASGEVETITFTIPANMGAAYGRISGDMNVVHTIPLIARLFGHRTAFIQGYATTNYLVKWLTRASNRSLRGLTTTLIRPLYVGDEVSIRIGQTQFEVFDARGKLAAYGAWE